jgi:type I restriction-modification system DNA methylase subunit
MNTTTHSLVQKLWNYCNVLRDDGMSYGDYVEQLTYLLFLKMADERSAAALQPAQHRACGLRLAHAAGQGWRRAV